jgi:cytochrome c-type biogenesis protein
MDSLFSTLTEAVHGSVPVAMGAAFAWGMLSIILSPCHLASIPLVVAFIGKQGTSSGRRAFLIAVVFAVGILVTIGVIGAITAALGRMLGDVGHYVNYGLALIFLYLGLHFLGVVPLPWTGGGPSSSPRRKGLIGALLLGLLFGIGVGPCTFAYMAPMLGVTFKLAATNFLYGALLLLAYGVGHCAVIVAAGTSTELVQRFLNWNEQSKGVTVIKCVCGVLVILGGVWLIYSAP